MSDLFIASRSVPHEDDGSRRVVVAGALIGPWMGVRIAPELGASLDDGAALTDAVMVPRRERRERAKAEEAAREKP